jgi:subtilisin-like proprotein convertase family protein
MNARAAIYVVAVLAAMLLAPMSASADVTSFSNHGTIVVPDEGPATPSASAVEVSGVRGYVTDVEVTLHGVTHTDPSDLDILLVPPKGAATVLMSDACGTGDVGNYTWTFNSTAPQMPGSNCSDFYYRPTDRNGGSIDNWPDVPPSVPGGGRLTDYFGKPMNGFWTLYVLDDSARDAGKIARGWNLSLTTVPIEAALPGTGTFGLANPYPLTKSFDIKGEVITDVNVGLSGIVHDRPDDLDMMLVGPQGQSVMLMSDACGAAELNGHISLDDQAPQPLPDGADPVACQGRVRPADYEPGDRLPPPAPDLPYASSLSAFDFTDPSGDWKLYAWDDSDGETGFLTSFIVDLQTRPRAGVEFADASVEVAEGGARDVTIRRTAPGKLGRGAAVVRTVPGSAAANADYTPVVTAVRFAPDEREKTIQIDARADGAAEPAESYAVTLSDANGDAALGKQTSLAVTIPKSDADPQQGGGGQQGGGQQGSGGNPPPVPRCAGKPATIVGTAKRDRINGTPRRDVIAVLGGNDLVRGLQGNDVVCGGRGRDVLRGGKGRDVLIGGAGRDRLIGGAGKDTTHQ